MEICLALLVHGFFHAGVRSLEHQTGVWSLEHQTDIMSMIDQVCSSILWTLRSNGGSDCVH